MPTTRCTTSCPAKNHVARYEYDDADRLKSLTTTSGGTWTFVRDASGNITKRTDAKGNATTYSYDELDRLRSRSYPSVTSTPTVRFSYDANSNVVSMIDAQDGTGESMSYDALDRLKTVARAGRSFTYGYDAAANVVSRTYPDGTQLSYGFDDDGRVASLVKGG